MSSVGPILVTVASGIGALILVYLLVSNPNGVIPALQTTGGFVISESKTLQGR